MVIRMLKEEAIRMQQELLASHRRTLTDLLGQQAPFGADSIPPQVAQAIADARTHIRRIKITLRAAGVAVADQPDDEPPPGPAAPSAQPPGPAAQPIGVQPNVATGGGDYAEGNIDKRHSVSVSGSGSVVGPVVADNSGTIITNYYQGVAPPKDDAAILKAALTQLAALPLDAIPAIAPLPDGSRMPFARLGQRG
jgi:hypothetical protein